MNIVNSWKIMKKDWKGTLHNKEILAALIIFPIMFTIALPAIMMIIALIDPTEFLSEYPGASTIIYLLNLSHLNPRLQAAKFVIKWMIIPFFLFVPGMTSSFIASDSFAGEKERKTMENLALLPITKIELIIGKVMTSFIPSLFITFTCFFGLGLITNLMFLPYLEGNILIFMDLGNILIGFLISPLISFLFIQINVIISSRAKTVKSAQSIGGSLIVPLFGIFFVQMINPAFLTPLIILIIAGIMGILSVLFVRLANKLLDIERLILAL